MNLAESWEYFSPLSSKCLHKNDLVLLQLRRPLKQSLFTFMDLVMSSYLRLLKVLFRVTRTHLSASISDSTRSF